MGYARDYLERKNEEWFNRFLESKKLRKEKVEELREEYGRLVKEVGEANQKLALFEEQNLKPLLEEDSELSL